VFRETPAKKTDHSKLLFEAECTQNASLHHSYFTKQCSDAFKVWRKP